MKWRNSKERELIAHGGCREQTLPTKHNPNPDLSDPVNIPSTSAPVTPLDQTEKTSQAPQAAIKEGLPFGPLHTYLKNTEIPPLSNQAHPFFFGSGFRHGNDAKNLWSNPLTDSSASLSQMRENYEQENDQEDINVDDNGDEEAEVSEDANESNFEESGFANQGT